MTTMSTAQKLLKYHQLKIHTNYDKTSIVQVTLTPSSY